MSDDDLEWLDALAGRESPDNATRREATALRAALKSQAATLDPVASEGARDRAREDGLVARARRDGVLPPARPRRLATWQIPLAAGVLLVFGATLVTQLQQPDVAPVVRGEDGVIRLEATDPAALKATLLAELRAAGVAATGYEALDVHGIDADLPQPLSVEVQRVLAAHGIDVPADGVLHIEIRSKR
jgi:hypothetical protein